MLFGTMHLEKIFSAVGVKLFRAFSTIVKHSFTGFDQI